MRNQAFSIFAAFLVLITLTANACGGGCIGGSIGGSGAPSAPSCGKVKVVCIKGYTAESGWVRISYQWGSVCSDPNVERESCNQYLLVYIADCPSGKTFTVNRDFISDFPADWSQLEGETECQINCPNPPTVPYPPCVQMKKN